MRLISMAFLVACNDQNLASKDTDTVTEDTGSGWDNYGDTDTDTDVEDTDSGDTDTDPQTEQPSPCQVALASTNPAYPVFPSWDGRESVNLTVTLTGAVRPWVTLSWGSATSTEGWWIGCADIVGQSTAVVRVEASSAYGASTFGNQDPADGSGVDANGFYWYPWSVTGGDLGGTQYVVQVDEENVNLVAVEQVPQ